MLAQRPASPASSIATQVPHEGSDDADRKRKLVADLPISLGLLAGLCRSISVRD